MIKADIVNEVAQATGIEKISVAAVLDAALESIKKSVNNNVKNKAYGNNDTDTRLSA